MTEMTVSETLNRAADLIQERGWTNGGDGWITDEYVAGSPVCLEGGIQAAMGLEGETNLDAMWACPAYAAVDKYLDVGPLYRWNDKNAKSAEQVVEVLRACAVIEASREREPAAVSS